MPGPDVNQTAPFQITETGLHGEFTDLPLSVGETSDARPAGLGTRILNALLWLKPVGGMVVCLPPTIARFLDGQEPGVLFACRWAGLHLGRHTGTKPTFQTMKNVEIKPLRGLGGQRFVPPLERRRKPGLGHYAGTREEWYAAWRRARSRHGQGLLPDPKDQGLEWKASLTVAYGRSELTDPLAIPVMGRLEAMRCVREIIGLAP